MWTGPLPLTKVNVTGGSGKLRSRIICAVFPISNKAIGVLMGPFKPIASTCNTLSSPGLASGPRRAYKIHKKYIYTYACTQKYMVLYVSQWQQEPQLCIIITQIYKRNPIYVEIKSLSQSIVKYDCYKQL